MGASYGAGNYGMCGRAYDPRFLFTWPNAKTAVMGAAAARRGDVDRRPRSGRGRRARRSTRRPTPRCAPRSRRRSSASRTPMFMSGRVYDDGIIDPRDTRTVLGMACPPSTPTPSRGAAASASSGCEDRDHASCSSPTAARSPPRVIRTARDSASPPSRVYSDADAATPRTSPRPTAGAPARHGTGRHLPRGDLVLAAAAAHRRRRRPPRLRIPLGERRVRRGACVDAGLVFVGPSPAAIDAMGSKIEAKELMAAAGVPVLPGATCRPAPIDPELGAAATIGYPVLVKAAFGGGGRGMRVVADADELAEAVRSRAAARPPSAFGDGTVFLERYVRVTAPRRGPDLRRQPRHRGASRRARVLDPAPPPEDHRGGAVARRSTPRCADEARAAAAVAAGQAIGYVGAGTVEFVLAPDGAFYFLEMNTRLQVEHPVTELVTGLDLVRAAAAGRRRRAAAARDARRRPARPRDRGAALRRGCRAGFMPVAGKLDDSASSRDRRAVSASTPASSPDRSIAPSTTPCWPR